VSDALSRNRARQINRMTLVPWRIRPPQNQTSRFRM